MFITNCWRSSRQQIVYDSVRKTPIYNTVIVGCCNCHRHILTKEFNFSFLYHKIYVTGSSSSVATSSTISSFSSLSLSLSSFFSSLPVPHSSSSTSSSSSSSMLCRFECNWVVKIYATSCTNYTIFERILFYKPCRIGDREKVEFRLSGHRNNTKTITFTYISSLFYFLNMNCSLLQCMLINCKQRLAPTFLRLN